MNDMTFTEAERNAVYKAIELRRDMRHFNGKQIPEKIFGKLINAAHLAPSVGLMEPWRFIRITDAHVRKEIHDIVEQERIQTARALGEREDEFLSLKVEGIMDCSEVLVAALPDKRQKHIFGRRTLPEMDLASLSCAIQNMWLAARVENIGLGWVSLFDPPQIKQLLGMPEGSHPVAILCVGYTDKFYDEPMLQEENWAKRTAWENKIMTNRWID
ncbi:MAG: 5,6-dimethylbenzimidazole synthase [Pseudomonadales bacterium]|nr:5,6-dimethylbenzimidazole synthase [Pseudomonadales bacterium]